MASDLQTTRLVEERKSWRRNHPHGFVARPAKNSDGSSNILLWKCKIKGKEHTEFDGTLIGVTLNFEGSEYPLRPPDIRFPDFNYHPNIGPSGVPSLSFIDNPELWISTTTIKDILLQIQDFLVNFNWEMGHNPQAMEDYQSGGVEEYKRKLRKELIKFKNV